MADPFLDLPSSSHPFIAKDSRSFPSSSSSSSSNSSSSASSSMPPTGLTFTLSNELFKHRRPSSFPSTSSLYSKSSHTHSKTNLMSESSSTPLISIQIDPTSSSSSLSSSVLSLQTEFFKTTSHSHLHPFSIITTPPDVLPSFQQRFLLFLDTTIWGYIYSLFDTILAFSFAILYIWTSEFVMKPLPTYLVILDFMNALFICLLFLPRLLFLYPTESWHSRFLRPAVLITFLTTLPTLLLRSPIRWFHPPPVYEHWEATLANHVLFLWPLRFLRLLWSIQRLLAISETQQYKWFPKLSLAQSKLVGLICGVICTLSTCAGFLHIIEFKYTSPSKIISFFDAFFFTSLIATTISYDSNIVPDALFPRSTILFIILIGIAFVPYGIAQVVSAMHSRSPFEKGMKRIPNQTHVVVVGAVHESFTLRHFLNEFLAQKDGSQLVHTKVVLLSAKDPPPKCLRLLREPQYRHRVQWVKGSPLTIEGLEKANVKKARACFVLAKKFSASDSRTTDAENVLRTMALAKCSPQIPIYVQCLLPENKQHFNYFAENVFCIDELKLAVLAWSCLCPGFSTLVYLFTTSIPQTIQSKEYMYDKSQPSLDYIHSYSQGIYPAILHPSLKGLRLSHIAQNLYNTFGVFLLAWKTKVGTLELFGGQPSSQTYVQGCDTIFYLGSGPNVALNVASFGAERMQSFTTKPPFSSLLPLPMSLDFPSFHRHRRISHFQPASVPTSLPIHSLKRFHTIDGSGREYTRDVEMLKKAEQKNFDAGSKNEHNEEEEEKDEEEGEEEEMKEKNEGDDASISTSPGARTSFSSPLLTTSMTSSSPVSAMSFENHILVCTPAMTFPSHLDALISILRENTSAPIVILSPTKPQGVFQTCLDQFENVFHVLGNPLVPLDLFKGGAEKVARVVVLADETIRVGTGREGSNDAEKTEDANVIMTLFNLKAVCPPNVFIVVEFIHNETMRLLTESDIHTASEIDTMEEIVPFRAPSFMAGNVFTVAMLDSIVAQAYHHPYLVHLLHAFLWPSSYAHVHQFLLPAPFIGQPCLHLVLHFLSDHLLVFGLFRVQGHQRFVLVAPEPHLILQKEDRVFVVGSKKLGKASLDFM